MARRPAREQAVLLTAWRPRAPGRYPRLMEISPNRENFPRLRVQVSDTVKPHNSLFPGMTDCHLGAGCRQRRVSGGVLVLLPVPGLSRVSLLSG